MASPGLPLSLVPVSLLPAVLQALSQDALGMLCRASRSFREIVDKHWSSTTRLRTSTFRQLMR
jgi:hypothetical protein